MAGLAALRGAVGPNGGSFGLAREIAEFFQHENGALRAAADELESALLHASGSNYRRVQEAMATVALRLANRLVVVAR